LFAQVHVVARKRQNTFPFFHGRPPGLDLILAGISTLTLWSL
jgi:hypothetical protein